MKVRMLQTVEDACELDPGDPLAEVQTFTVGHRKWTRHIARVDKLRAATVVELPGTQAADLIALGYAEQV